MSVGFWIIQILNALQLAMLLFLLSLGLSIILGLMNFVNLAHASLYSLGAFFSYSISHYFGYYSLAYILAPLAVIAVGAVLYGLVIDRMRRRSPLDQVLLTFGLIFIFVDIQKYFWGTDHLGVENFPFDFSIRIWGETYPAYRLMIILCGFLIFMLLRWLLKYSRWGVELRAAVCHSELAAAAGVSVQKVFWGTFLLGCGLAGFAGAVALPAFSAHVGMGVQILIPTLVVVVVGGLGHLSGAFVASLLIATTLTFGQVLLPQLATILTYSLAVLTLLFKSKGLLAR